MKLAARLHRQVNYVDSWCLVFGTTTGCILPGITPWQFYSRSGRLLVPRRCRIVDCAGERIAVRDEKQEPIDPPHLRVV
jgi:hypothetical protein